MQDTPDPVPGPENRPDARLKRDAALRRVGRARRWVIGSSAALTAGFAVLVAEVAPGHSAAASNAKSSSAASQPAMPAVASPSSLGLSAPAQAPQSVPQPQPQAAPAPSSGSSQNDAPVSGGS
jgi:predicted component of type VI protein secretion system